MSGDQDRCHSQHTMVRPEDKPLRGNLLTTWVEQSGLRQADVARHLGNLTRAGLHHWLTGRVQPDVARVADLDTLLGAGGALVSLWRAAVTPQVWPHRCAWEHNFRSSPGPVWVWVRSAASTPIRAQFHWGAALTGQATVDPGPGGIVIFSPAGVDNPPLRVFLDPPGGWVDFGHGAFTRRVLGNGLGARLVTHLEALDHAHVEEGPLRDPGSARALAAGLARVRALLDTHGVPWRTIQQNLHAFVPTMTVHDHQPASEMHRSPEVHLRLDGAELRRVRRVLGISQQTAANAVTRLEPEAPVTRDRIRGLEEGARRDCDGLVWRLDLVYGADGMLGADRCPTRRGPRGTWIVTYPTHWVGPVWVHLQAPEPGVVELLWAPWRRRQRLSRPVVVAFRKSSPSQGPLIVVVAPHVKVSAGTGVIPGACDVNQGWYPHSIVASIALLRKAITILQDSRPVLGSSPPGDDPAITLM